MRVVWRSGVDASRAGQSVAFSMALGRTGDSEISEALRPGLVVSPVKASA